jgi:transposase-like protein
MDTPNSAKIRAMGVKMEKGQRRKRRRFSDEYKAETVRLIQTSGKTIGKMALELGIGETALRRWVEEAETEAGRGPAGALKRSEREELAELRRENQRLRMEREILKKGRPSSPKRASEIRFHRGGEGLFSGGVDVSGAASLTLGILRVAHQAGGSARAPGSNAGHNRGCDLCAKPRPVRQSKSACGTARERSARRAQSCCPADAGAGFARPATPALSLHQESRHGLAIKGNLLAQCLAAAQPNTAWLTYITYLWTLEGWLYLAVILDLFSRRVVGWSMSESLQRQLALDAVKMALADRQPPHGLIHHSDRGSQYASSEYQQLLQQHGIIASMSRRGNCRDNAVAESFFATLKLELVYQNQWSTRAQARTAIFEYIELFYNRRRRHSAIGYLCPNQFELRHESMAA